MSPFGMERVRIAGPHASLKPRHALSLGMVLHELATNAGKYGALSVPSGEVSIEWTRTSETPGDRVDLYWRETNGPPAPSAPRRGFGLKLIERETSYNLRGVAAVTFAPAGVEAHISFCLVER
jgi:two-component sensor histidine kinase